MKLEIVTVPGQDIGSGTQITVKSIPQAIRALQAHCASTYGDGVQRVNDFRWDCWNGTTDFQVSLSDGTHPLEFVNHGGQTVKLSLTALQAQVSVFKNAIPMGGQTFYRGLQDFLDACKTAADLANTECLQEQSGDGIKHAERMQRTMRSIRQALCWAKEQQLQDGPGVGSRMANAQWEALLALTTAFEEAVKQRYADVFGCEYFD